MTVRLAHFPIVLIRTKGGSNYMGWRVRQTPFMVTIAAGLKVDISPEKHMEISIAVTEIAEYFELLTGMHDRRPILFDDSPAMEMLEAIENEPIGTPITWGE